MAAGRQSSVDLRRPTRGAAHLRLSARKSRKPRRVRQSVGLGRGRPGGAPRPIFSFDISLFEFLVMSEIKTAAGCTGEKTNSRGAATPGLIRPVGWESYRCIIGSERKRARRKLNFFRPRTKHRQSKQTDGESLRFARGGGGGGGVTRRDAVAPQSRFIEIRNYARRTEFIETFHRRKKMWRREKSTLRKFHVCKAT